MHHHRRTTCVMSWRASVKRLCSRNTSARRQYRSCNTLTPLSHNQRAATWLSRSMSSASDRSTPASSSQPATRHPRPPYTLTSTPCLAFTMARCMYDGLRSARGTTHCPAQPFCARHRCEHAKATCRPLRGESDGGVEGCERVVQVVRARIRLAHVQVALKVLPTAVTLLD